MEFSTITWIWLITGIVFLLFELIIPGLVIIFLGLGAIIVALLRFTGIITSELNSFTAWFIISLLLIIVLRWTFLKFFPPETSYDPTKEDEHAVGTIVEVIDKIEAGNTNGRIRYRGTTWAATCHDGAIIPPAKARLLYLDNVTWIVEPAD